MSRLSYFQRFSQRENHATNNTLLVVRHFYQSSPLKVEAILSALADEELTVGLSFEQQVRSASSTPDALISQKPLDIYIETKRGGELDKDQVIRHIASIGQSRHPATRVILFGLTRTAIAQSDKVELARLAAEAGVMFVSITFGDVVTALRSVCAPYETDLTAILADYEEYLLDEDLIQIGDVMTVVACGTSIEENVRHRLYFEPAERPSKARSEFIGLYRQKCVRYLAKPVTIITGVRVADTFTVTNVELGALSDEERGRIDDAIAACTYFPDFAQDEHRYYLFGDVHETEIHKSSRGGIWGPRVFNLSEWLDYDNPSVSFSTEDAARLLRGKSFE